MNGSVQYIDIDDPNAVAGHVWAHSPDEAERTVYEGVEGQAATVTAGDLEFSVGFDPGEDGLLWCVTADAGDGQRELVSNGGWAPGDRGTAESEIASVIDQLHGNWRAYLDGGAPVSAPVDAQTVAAAVARALGTTPGPCRNGAYSVDTTATADAASVWRLWIGDDPDADAPHGISWGIDSPDEGGVESGGWEVLPASDLADAARVLAGRLTDLSRHWASAPGVEDN